MSAALDRPPVIHLHIGRNKAGSTTLQDYFVAHHAELERHGVRYALYGHLKDSVPGIIGFNDQLELATYARSHREQAILVSNEFMFGWPEAYTHKMAQWLRGLDTRVIAYLRPYGAWAHSNYAQDVRSGDSVCDFDEYLEQLWPRISALPHLETWGHALGWDHVRVRSIDARGVHWDALVSDCLHAIGLHGERVAPAAASNQSPHWTVIELLRALNTVAPAITDPLHSALEHCLIDEAPPCPAAQYLTPTQHRRLAELYREDLTAISRYTGTPLQEPRFEALPERPFLPAFDQIPCNIRRTFTQRVCAVEFMRLHPQAADAVAAL
jgi:hypothetical protein